MRYPWISFTTDYGLTDGFVAACHGVIAARAPEARVIDVTHLVPPQHIRHGAVALAQTAPYLPEAVHVGVVDPGVGTARRAVVVTAARGLLVGPDNGLLLPAAEALGGVVAAHELTAPAYRLGSTSVTFHGRDIFAPAAAHLARGVRPEEFGAPVDDLVELPPQPVTAREGLLRAEVLSVDGFGNVALAASSADLRTAALTDTVLVRCGDVTLPATAARTFADVPTGDVVLFEDSSGRPAVAVNGGSAANALAIGNPATPPTCELTPPPGREFAADFPRER